MHGWFGLLPNADVVIQPYPKFREKSGPNEYNPPAEDGSRPAVFFINAYQAEKKSRVEVESTAFHETIPGHHLQGAIALGRKEIHPIGRQHLMGPAFDIKNFHDRVLEDGAVPVRFLHEKIKAWAKQ